eukprot:CAMPEP_0173462360 /NCGR_PEP_ID=MMETSP1357-20121228/66524_1 /TAXON_ID=77926 /ORGANISM="Hemiselmis rufescens, Strain PCC563" /LENGTH=324 /DNA_ID=CAMNT_0014430085 /DNA_START=134 /DNA_END=1108 /DNA_ORIENTATION=+
MARSWAALCLLVLGVVPAVHSFAACPLRAAPALSPHRVAASSRPASQPAGSRRGLGSGCSPSLGLRMIAEEQKPISPLTKDSEVVIIGASRGIGLELVKQIAAKGSHVIATYRNEPTEQLRKAANKHVTLVQCDVGDVASVQEAANAVKGKVRSGITHVIHNAGVLQSADEDPDQDWSLVKQQEMLDLFRINAVGPLLVIQAFEPLLAKPKPKGQCRPGACCLPIIAVISSKVGSVTDNGSGGMYAYRASKSAANHIAKCLSIDMADQAKVVLLHPGYVRTDMTEHMGFIDPPESVTGMIRAIEATGAETPFRWVDYKAEVIPF